MILQEEIQIPADRKITVHIMRDLEEIMAVEATVDRLMQLVVRHRVQGLRIHPACILSVDHLAHQPELRLHLVREVAKRMLEAHIEHIGTVETETIDVKGIDPVLHDIDQIFTDALAVEVQLRELPGTAPCTVVEAVAPW